MKWLKIVSGMFLLAFCSLVGASSQALAVSDLTATIDSSNYSSFSFNCGNDCSSYHYLLITDISGSSSFTYSFCPYSSDLFARLVVTHNAALYNNVNFFLFNFDNIDQMSYCAANFSSGVSFTAKLSENNPFGSTPTGSITFTENGTYDVTQYSEAVVDIPPIIEPGDYHDDLVSIKQAIIICASVVLVIYFFYCIYRIIIKAGKR